MIDSAVIQKGLPIVADTAHAANRAKPKYNSAKKTIKISAANGPDPLSTLSTACQKFSASEDIAVALDS